MYILHSSAARSLIFSLLDVVSTFELQHFPTSLYYYGR